MRKGKGFIFTGAKSIGVIFSAEPKIVFLHSLFTVLHGLSWALQMLFTQRFFDATQSFAQKSIDMTSCVIALVGMVASYAFCQTMNGVDNCHARILNLAIARHINQKLFKCIDKLGCIDFESTHKLNYINKAIDGGANIAWISLTVLDIIFFYGTYFVFISSFLFAMKPILSISILAIFTPCLLSNIIQTQMVRDLETASVPIRRECEQYERYTTDIRETRLYGATDYFKRLYFSCLKKLNKLLFKAQLRKNTITLLSDSITVIGYGSIILMIFLFVLRQEITIGAFAAVLATVGRFFSFMSEVISERIGWASENIATAENYISFISDNTVDESERVKVEHADIILKNIGFTYPTSTKPVLHDINLTIEKGQTIAIVGENGSGKTTLSKLILGIYPPSKGNIFIGGVPIEKASNENISAVYQDYCRYKMTLRQNITISNLD
jgi:ATP-binding cassette subfamily B protein